MFSQAHLLRRVFQPRQFSFGLRVFRKDFQALITQHLGQSIIRGYRIVDLFKQQCAFPEPYFY